MVKFEYEKDIWKKFIEPKKFAFLLEKIEEIELSPRLERARDMFVFSC